MRPVDTVGIVHRLPPGPTHDGRGEELASALLSQRLHRRGDRSLNEGRRTGRTLVVMGTLLTVLLSMLASCGKQSPENGSTSIEGTPTPVPTRVPAASCAPLQKKVRDTITACHSAASNPVIAQILGKSCGSALMGLQVEQCSGLQSRVRQTTIACSSLFNTYSSFLKTACRQALQLFMGAGH